MELPMNNCNNIKTWLVNCTNLHDNMFWCCRIFPLFCGISIDKCNNIKTLLENLHIFMTTYMIPGYDDFP